MFEVNGEDFSRHESFSNYAMFVRYGLTAFEGGKDKAEPIPYSNKAKLTFGKNLNLDITKNVKIVEAHRHNKDRLTLIYQDLGAFTFKLRKPKGLHEVNLWHGEHNNKEFRVKLQLTRNKEDGRLQTLSGQGKDESDDPMSMTIYLNQNEEQTWYG